MEDRQPPAPAPDAESQGNGTREDNDLEAASRDAVREIKKRSDGGGHAGTGDIG